MGRRPRPLWRSLERSPKGEVTALPETPELLLRGILLKGIGGKEKGKGMGKGMEENEENGKEGE